MVGFLATIYDGSFDLTSDATIGLDDGLAYASEIEAGGPLFHPHHLLYNWIGSMIWRLQNYLRPDHATRAVVSLRLLSAIAGSLGVGMLYLLLVRLTSRPVLSAAFSMGLAFNRGYWFYSASAESIIPGAVAAIPVLYALVLLLEEASARRFFLLGIAGAAAYLMRQDNALLYLLAAAFIPSMRRGARFKGFLLGTVAMCAIVCVLQLACFSSVNRGSFSWNAFWQWSSSYASIPGWGTFENLRPSGISVSLVKLLHAMGYGSVQHLALIRPESLSHWVCRWSRLNSILFAAFSAVFLFCVAPRTRIRLHGQRVMAIFCAAWIVLRELFFTWLVPETVMGFSVGTMIPIVIVLAVVFSNALNNAMRRAALSVVMAGLVVTSSVSGLLTIIPFSKSTYINKLAFFNRFSGPGDLVIVREFHQYPLLTYYGMRDAAILDYYHNEEFRSLDEQRIRGQIESTWARGGKVFLMPGGRVGDPYDDKRRGAERRFFAPYAFTPLKNEGGDIAAWMITRRSLN